MKTRMGVWIDHKKAVIMDAAGTRETAFSVVSNVESHLQRTGELPRGGRFEPQKVPADNRQQRAYLRRLNEYYDSVVAHLRDAESIMICGPGEAKIELKKRLEKSNLGSRISGMETADKMTESQFAAKTRNHFLHLAGS